MTAYEMQRAMERIIQQTDPQLMVQDKPSSDTIFQYLYQYTLIYIRNIYLQADAVNNETRANNKVIDSIKGLATRVILRTSNSDSLNTNTVKVTLPEDYFLYIRSNSNMTSNYTIDASVEGITANKVMKEENVEQVLTTFYNKPIIRNPYVVFKSDFSGNTCSIEIIHDNYSVIDKIELLYYRKPKQFGTTNIDGDTKLDRCELPDNVHMEIVEGAAKLYLQDRLGYRSQSNKSEQ